MSSVIEFIFAGIVALAASALLVVRIERVGARFGLTEAALGLVTALAANAPEITSAVTALTRGQRDIGVGVILGSNVFNLAALLGLGALVAGRIDLHRRVVVFGGGVAMSVALISGVAVTRVVSVDWSFIVALVVFVPYVIVSAWPRVIAPRRGASKFATWVREALREEEVELRGAIHPESGDWRDAALAGTALLVVVLASVLMEHTAAALGASMGWSSIVIGGVLLAGVTSLPNAVAAIYLSARGRGAAAFSEALNSNNLNVLAGLLTPAVFLGLGHPAGPAEWTVGFYEGLTLLSLVMAYVSRGLGRLSGAVLIAGYVAYVVVITR